MRIGALRRQFALEKEIIESGSAGLSAVWVQVAEIWAALEPVLPSTNLRLDRVEDRASHKATLRVRSDIEIANGMRLVSGKRIFAIRKIVTVFEKNRWWELSLQEGGLLVE